MGKGDKKSKRGKIIIGSHGVRRPKKKSKGSAKPVAAEISPVKPAKPAAKPKAEPVVAEAKPKAVKKTRAEAKPKKEPEQASEENPD